MRTITAARRARGQSGAGLIETMVGILIGLLVVLVVYNMLAVAEGYKRMTTGAADAQITGLIGQFLSSQDAGNGGNGYTSAFADLINCHNSAPGVPYTANNTLKPISVLVTAGALPTDPDSFIARHGVSPHVVWSVAFRSAKGVPFAPGAPITVQSPNGFNTPAKASIPTGVDPFWAIAIANEGSGVCELIQIQNSGPPNAFGEVVLTQGPTYASSHPYEGVPNNDEGTGSLLLNLGRQNQNGAARVLYDVANNQLRTTNCMFPDGCLNAAAVARPIAQNVVWMKVQYGIDTTPVPVGGTLDGTVDCWTAADANTPACAVGGVGDWSPNVLKDAGVPASGVPADTLNRIVAVRIALVVRSDEPDFTNPALYSSPATTIDGKTGTRQDEYLFNCAANNATCQNRILIPRGAAAPNVLLDGWRYRTYEAVIPLRNSIFNATLPP